MDPFFAGVNGSSTSHNDSFGQAGSSTSAGYDTRGHHTINGASDPSAFLHPNPEISITPASPSMSSIPQVRFSEVNGNVSSSASRYSSDVPAVMFPITGATRTGDHIFMPPRNPSSPTPNGHPINPTSNYPPSDSVAGFLASMPTRGEDPTRYNAWVELVQMKTRSLELQIAEARLKEREAELELARLKAGTASLRTAEDIFGSTMTGSISQPQQSGSTSSNVDVEVPPITMTEFNRLALSGYGKLLPKSEPEITAQQQMNTGISTFDSFPFVNHALPPESENTNIVGELSTQTPMTPYDLEVMMQEDNLESLFSWLPTYNDPTSGVANDNQSNTIDPSMMSYNPSQSFPNTFDTIPNTTSPRKRQSPSPSSDNSDPEPPSKRKKIEKKIVIDHSLNCPTCTRTIGRIMIRAPKSSIPSPTSPAIHCLTCRPVEVMQRGTMIGTVDSRKRLRVSMEVDDEDGKVGEERRRVFCDVCQRVVGVGVVWGGFGGKRESLAGMVEVVCGGCDGKYQRCTDCGGGGGPRVGIGKWRMKQVFQPGRKTCGLSHSRLGDRPREIGVHVTPTDYTTEQLEQVVARCKGLWNEKTLSRLAVPEMLEIDLPANLINPLKNYGDVEEIVTGNWPTREAMIRAEGADPERYKRVLGLTWAQAKPRRSARTVDLEEEYAKATEVDGTGDMSTVLANIKRTNVIIPAGHELVGMWGGEWDMQHGALLISTLIPFEGADGEDSTALSVGEMITKIQTLRLELNAKRKAAAGNGEIQLIPQCEHLWVVSGGTMPLVRERLADVLIRKRSFVHVDEYLVRHPDFTHALQARPYGLHPDLQSGNDREAQKPLVLVRWLGKDFDSQKILEIKQQEFGGGGKARIRKRAKSKV